MNTVTQITRRRQALVLWAQKKGVTSAARRYNVSRQLVYRWMKRYDGTLESLQDHSHRPKSHPNQHTEDEIKLIKDMRKRNKHTGRVRISNRVNANNIHKQSGGKILWQTENTVWTKRKWSL